MRQLPQKTRSFTMKKKSDPHGRVEEPSFRLLLRPSAMTCLHFRHALATVGTRSEEGRVVKASRTALA